MDASSFGALGFGLILGWYTYYINRYRKSDVQFSDITTLVAAIGGAAVLALFPAGSALFGWYGIGLACGFFAYFVTLLILVWMSENFDADWFLDGRRKDPADGVSIPGDAKKNIAPMALKPDGPSSGGFHGTNPGTVQNFYVGRGEDAVLHMPRAMAAPSSTLDEATCHAVVFAETATLEVDADGLDGLIEARRFIAAVAYKRNGDGVAKPRYPSQDELKQPFIKKAWDRCGVAAKDGKMDDVGKCKHFVIWYSDDGGKTPSKLPKEIHDKWPYQQTDKITKSWGPYKANDLGKDNIYVIQYCGVP